MARKSKRSRSATRKRSEPATKRAAPQAGAGHGGEMRWRVLPCARDWRLTTATVVLLLLVLAVVHFAFGHVGWVAISGVLLLASLSSFFFPTTYTLDDEGVAVRGLFGTTRRRWRALRSHRVDAHGVLLSPLSGPSRLEGFRGVYLRFHNNRGQVMAIVTARTKARAGRERTPEGKT